MRIETKEIALAIGQFDIRLRVVSNLDKLLADISNDDEIPFWAELWPSALVLAKELAVFSSRGKALELGCGLGLPGLILAKQAWQVLQTDYISDSLNLAKINADLNGVKIEQALGDWREFPELGTFDCVIASDILYEPQLYDCLYEVLMNNTHEKSAIFIADPGRSGARDFLRRFSREYWQLETKETPFSHQGLNYIINIYKLTRLT